MKLSEKFKNILENVESSSDGLEGKIQSDLFKQDLNIRLNLNGASKLHELHLFSQGDIDISSVIKRDIKFDEDGDIDESEFKILSAFMSSLTSKLEKSYKSFEKDVESIIKKSKVK